jgi:hypothetical protein
MPSMNVDANLLPAHEPSEPAADSLLRRFLLNWTTAIDAHGLALGGDTLRRAGLAAVDVGRPSIGGNVATLLAPLCSERMTEVTAALNDFYHFSTGERCGAVYLFSPWPTPDLAPYGWTLDGDLPFMLRPAGGEPPPPPRGLRVEEVRDEAGLRAFELALVRGFELPELATLGPGAAFSPVDLADERRRRWVGWADGKPVCAAASFIDAGVINVDLVATVPEARRRGYGEAVTWRATLAAPHLPSLLLATEAGRPVYERIGYLTLFPFTLWSRERSCP